MMVPYEKCLGKGELDLSKSSTNRVRILGKTKKTKEAIMTVVLYRFFVDILCTISPPSNSNAKRKL